MAGLAEAVLFFRIGAPFEDAVFNKTANLMPDLEVVDCRKGIELVPEEEHGHAGRGQAPPDPHAAHFRSIASPNARIYH